MPENTEPQTAADEARAALAPVIERGTIVLRSNPDASLTEIAAAITEEPPLHDPLMTGAVMPFPAIPEPVVLDEEAIEALKALPAVFGQVNLDKRRTLTDLENQSVYTEMVVVKKVLETLKGREEALKEYVRTSFDVAAEEAGLADPETSPRDQHGHYVLGEKGKPERLPIPGTNKAWSREMRGGTTTLDGARLKELYEAEAITKEEYYAFTREVRVFDEEKARKSLAKDPNLLGLLARITKRGGVGSALFTRKK